MGKSIILFIFLLVCIPLHAFVKDFKVWDTSDGLPDNTVKCFAQDSLGFIWMGTFNGLCRFDGRDFTVYRHEPGAKNTLVHNHVEALLVVGNDLWVGSEGGLMRYSSENDEFRPCTYLTDSGEERSLDWSIRNMIYCDGRIWILTNGNRLWVQESECRFVNYDFGKDADWLAIANYKDNLFLAYGVDGLYLLDAREKTIVSRCLIRNQPTYTRTLYYILYYSHTQDLVYAGAGIGHTGTAFQIDSSLNIRQQNDFALPDIKAVTDYQGGVMFGTDGGGLVEWKDGKFTRFTPQNSAISSDAVHALFVDAESDCLWIGTYRGGLDFYSPSNNRFHVLSMTEGGLSHNVVTDIYPEEDKIYIALDGGGLNVFDKSTGKVAEYSRRNSNIAGNSVVAMCADREYLWMAVYEKGLCRFSRTQHTFKTYDLSSIHKDYNANQLWDVCQDEDGYIWILGTAVYVFEPQTEQFTLIEGIRDASGIVFGDEAVWISSVHSGLYELDKKTRAIRAHYDKDSNACPLASNVVRYIFMDSKQALWLAMDCGLYKMEEGRKHITSYADRKELINSRVVSIQEGSHGELWMGTYNGLYKYVSADDSFTHFGKEDNLDVGQFNYHACARAGNLIYMGATKGLVWFESQATQRTHQPHAVCFTDLELLNESREKCHLFGTNGQTITLPYDKNFFTIRFTVPEMITPDKLSFSCHLQGFEQAWQELGTKRQVSYTNVSPGEYIFHVMASDGSGHWNTEASCLRIIITPPWWQTGWAWCLWVLLIAGALFSVFWFYRHELNIQHLVQLKEIEKNTERNINEAKLRFYTNVVHELRTPIFLITAPLEELLSGNKRTISVPKSYLAGMYRNAMKLNKLITRMIDLRKLEQGKLKLVLHSQNVVSFCKDLVPDYEALCQQKNIIFHFLPEKTLIKVAFDAEKLEIILSNLISNAFKYTPEGGKVVLSIHETAHEVVFTVEDNGIGIKKEFQERVFDRFFQVDSSQTTSSGDGIGLSFVKHLVELHGGTVSLESESGRGAKFVFTLPIGEVEEEMSTDEVTALETPLESKTLPLSDVQTSSPAASHTILLIDDEPEILELLERSLVEDFQVLKATNGIDGLELVRKEMPDLVVCDIMMPKLDGMEFLRLMRGDKMLAHIPVIMLTAKMGEEDQIKAFDSGADAYLTKPVSLKYLRNRIDHLLARAETVNMAHVLTQTEKNYTKEEQRFLLKCKEVIDEHLMNPDLSVVFLAEKLGMSHSSFYRKIKSVTGMSGIDFINEYRIFKAVQLFKSGETNVSSVCVQCGFNDIKTFRDAFKKKMQVSPKQYVMQLDNK